MRKDLRLRRGELFSRAYKEGKALTAAEVVLYFLYAGEGPTRIGFAVGKKVGKAVVRNKTRRRLKSIVAAVADNLKNGYILVFVGRPPAADSAFSELRDRVYQLLKQANVFKDVQ